MQNGRVMIIRSIVGSIKKALYKMSQYFPKPHEPFGGDINVKVDLVNNDVVKKTEYNNLANKVNNIDTSRFILKTKYDAEKLELEKKSPDTNNLIKKADYNTKISEIENKILIITNLATKTALSTVENKISDVSNLVKKQIITQRLLKLKIKLLIINTMNT